MTSTLSLLNHYERLQKKLIKSANLLKFSEKKMHRRGQNWDEKKKNTITERRQKGTIYQYKNLLFINIKTCYIFFVPVKNKHTTDISNWVKCWFCINHTKEGMNKDITFYEYTHKKCIQENILSYEHLVY